MCPKVGLYCYDQFFQQSYEFVGLTNSVSQAHAAKYKKMQQLTADFYLQSDVAVVAQQLLGKVLVHQYNNQLLAARIVETEAYAGIHDRASHAWGGRRTQRTQTMYAAGGTAYVYQCYGIHQLFNVVTNAEGVPDAVLIRAVAPLWEVPLQHKPGTRLPGSGPGLVTRLLQLNRQHNGMSLLQQSVYIADDGFRPTAIAVSRRIGVEYAGTAANWLYRFFLPEHPHVTPHPINKEAILLL